MEYIIYGILITLGFKSILRLKSIIYHIKTLFWNIKKIISK